MTDLPEGARALVRPAAAQEALEMGAVAARFVATGDLTDRSFGLFHWGMGPRAGGPPPHLHRTFSESFYVLSGTVSIYDGSAWHEASAGDFMYVPPGTGHAFSNASDAPAAMLILFAPGAPRERYFRALAEMRADGVEMSPEERAAFLAEHDQYPAP
jgi:quercetin dioxygenase-like cupin family protein